MNALSTITMLPKDAAERKLFVKLAVSELIEGKYNILDIHPRIIEITKLFTDIKDDHEYKSELKSKAGDFVSAFGYDFKMVPKRTFDYSACNDSEWNELNTEIDRLKIAMKERERFLQALPANGTVNPETGEWINRPAISVTEYYKVEKSK